MMSLLLEVFIYKGLGCFFSGIFIVGMRCALGLVVQETIQKLTTEKLNNTKHDDYPF